MAQVHRFREKVAVSLETGETAYLSATEARKIARAMNAAAREITKGVAFTDSKVGTVQITLESRNGKA
ncbi:hypothetical protein ABDF71_21620 [Ochrobactrum sp. WV_118_8]